MIAIVRRTQSGELFGVLFPVEFTAVHDTAADCRAVPVEIFCGGMGNDIRTPFYRTAIHGRCKSIVDDERNAVRVRDGSEQFDIQHGKRGIGDGFAEDRFRVRAKCLIELFPGSVGRNKGEFDTHFLHRYGKKVICTAVNFRAGNDVIAAVCNIENAVEVCRLPGRGEHCGGAAFELTDLCRDIVVGRVLQTGVKISARFQIEKFAHILAGIVFERGALYDGNLSRFSVFRLIAALNANCISFHIGLLI